MVQPTRIDPRVQPLRRAEENHAAQRPTTHMSIARLRLGTLTGKPLLEKVYCLDREAAMLVQVMLASCGSRNAQ